MKANLIVAAMLVCTIMFSCHQESAKEKETMADLTLAAPEPPGEGGDANQQIPFSTSQQLNLQDSNLHAVKPGPSMNLDRKIIKTAAVKLEVKQFGKYNEILHQKIQQYGAYIAGEDNFFTGEKSEMVVLIKVPVEHFESLMNDLVVADTKVLERSIKSEDVSSQVVDTKSRLEAKKAMRLKYLEFLKQSKNMEEVLQVQGEINGLQEEIEAAAGRIQYLTIQAAYSTINLTFYEPLPGFEPVNTAPSFFTSAAEGFKTGADFLKNIILGLITIWPLLIIGFGAAYVWKRNKPAVVIKTKG